MKFMYHLSSTLLFLFSFAITFSYAIDMNVGDSIASFSANDENGNLWNLKDNLNNKYLVVYFYPAALTGGWTKQAQGYRDSKDELDGLNIKVIGISGDAVSNLKHFKKSNNLNFTLLSDITGEIASKFGVSVKEGGTFTKTFENQEIEIKRSYTPSRWTFILDNTAKIIYKDTEVDFNNDNQEVINFLKELK